MRLTEDQTAGIEFLQSALKKYRGALCADVPGYGKTGQGIDILKSCLLGSDKPALVVVPSYLVLKWLEEFDNWGVNASMCVIDSRKQILHDAAIYIGSYDMIAAEPILKQLFKKQFSLLLCDEGHTFRTWNSKRSRYLLGTFQNKKSNIRYRSEKTLLLTGTPIVNTVEDIYNVIVRIAPKVLKDWTKEGFIIHFSKSVYSTPWGLKVSGIKNEKALQKLLKPVVLRRTEIKGLRDAIRTYIPLKMSKSELRNYVKEEEKFLRSHGIQSNDIINVQKMTNEDGETFATLRKKVSLFKVPLVLPAILDSHEIGERPIVYSWHKDTQRAIVDALRAKKKSARVEFINGETPLKTRHEYVKAYQAGDIDILCPTIGALREGVDLTEGRKLILVELPYTPAELEQVIARLARKGQKNIVNAQIFHFTGGVDQHIINILKTKQTVIDNALHVSK